MPALSTNTTALIDAALREDIGSGDITTEAIVPPSTIGRAKIIAREVLTVCGQDIAQAVFKRLDSAIAYQVLVPDGAKIASEGAIAEITGPLRAILSGERVALNFLQHLSGIATLTSHMASLISGTGVKLLDTRKTTPAWRELEKYAVSCGGGTNHRRGLFDQVLIKNNHIDALSGDIPAAIRTCRGHAPAGTKIEVEVRDLAELEQALRELPDIILLDNMAPKKLAEAVAVVKRFPGSEKIVLEASGGITEANIRAYAETGVHALSLGKLTHSAQAVDISLRYQHESA